MRTKFLLLAAAAFAAFGLSGSAAALSGSQFQVGHIIDDSVFFNRSDMSVDQIQSFLEAQVPICDNNGNNIFLGTYNGTDSSGVNHSPFPGTHTYSSSDNIHRSQLDNRYQAPYTCLSEYRENTVTHQNNVYGNINGTSGTNALPSGSPCDMTTSDSSFGQGVCSGAQIIFAAQIQYGVSAKAIITTIQKEQGLVGDDWPWWTEYKSAAGYGCPDTAACNSSYYGFYNQVINAAWQFRQYAANPNNYNYIAGITNNIQFKPNSTCGTEAVFIQNQATAGLYNYTPYVPNQAALNNLSGLGDSCSSYGNRNFWRDFNEYFGNTLGSEVITSTSGGAVYLSWDGYKFPFSSMAMLQDYGFDPGAIATYPQSYIDSVPTPDSTTGLSGSMSYLVRSPSNAAVYLVSEGRKYLVTSLQQLSDFGYNTNQVSYLPDTFVNSIISGGNLSYFVYTPTHATFQVTGGQKHLILDSAKYQSLNPSNAATPISYNLASTISSGVPLASKPTPVRTTGGAIYLFDASDNSYHAFSSMDAFGCWGNGAGLPQTTPLYQLYSDTYVASITNTSSLPCIVNDGSGNTYLLNRVNRLSIPSALGLSSGQTLSSSLMGVASNLPLYSSPLSQVLKANNSAAIYFVQSGNAQAVPTMEDFSALGLTSGQIQVLDPGAMATIPASGVKLADGIPTKANEGAAVYVQAGGKLYTFATGEDYNAFHYTWGELVSFPLAQLEQNYSLANQSVNRYLYDQGSGSVFLMDVYGCYKMTNSMTGDYGQNASTLSSGQPYNSSIFRKASLGSCVSGSNYASTPGSSTVYWVSGNVKHPFASWPALLAHNGGSAPQIISVSASTLSPIPTGQTLQ